MWIAEGNVNVRVTRATDEEIDWLSAYLTFKPASVRYTGGSQQLYNRISASFPAGMLSMVRKAAERDGIAIEYADMRAPPLARDVQADLAWLRDYQREAVEAMVARERGIIAVPTSGGKTEIMVGISRALPGRWLMLVHRSNLVTQTAARYEKRSPGKHAGVVLDGKILDDWSTTNFLCGTVQTFNALLQRNDPRALEILKNADGLLVDEAHTVPAASALRVLSKVTHARYRFGLSGTPLDREDKRSILAVAMLGNIIYKIAASTLIAAGVVVAPRIRMIECRQRVDRSTWEGVVVEGITKSRKRNGYIGTAMLTCARPALVFVNRVEHGRILHAWAVEKGLRSRFVWGEQSQDERNAIAVQVQAGELDVVICSPVWVEGVDIPNIRSCIMACGGKSIISALQRVGRGMRVAPGKTTFDVYDIQDRDCGCFDTERAHRACLWLDKHAKQRVKSYRREAYTVIEEIW